MFLVPAWTAWILVVIALVVVGCNWRYLSLHPRGEKRWLKIFNILASGYIILLYILLGSGAWHISDTAALFARVGFFILLCLLSAESIADWT